MTDLPLFLRRSRILPRLVPSGEFFRLETGERFTAIECSDFNLLARFIAGEAAPILRQRADCGFNMVRVFTLYSIPGIGHLVPCPYGQIPAFCRTLARYGLYAEFVAYTSIEDPEHWGRLTNAVRGHAALAELVNEYDHPSGVNHIDLSRYQKAPGVLCAHGSNCSQTDPVRPAWGYETYHTNDAPEWWRKVGKQAWEYSVGWCGVVGSGVPVLSNENTRYPDHDDNVQHAYDAAAGAALLTAGSCYHSVAGKTSTLWTGVELEAAKAWAAGARSVPLECQAGSYVHRDDLEGPNVIRVYERPVPGYHCAVRIRR